jgi:RNA polymerase sigma factor (sigma-70 family)
MRMAKRYETTGIPFKDLVQQGILGLIKAVDRFDWTKGYQFSTYAMWWIRVELQEAVAGCGMTVLPAKAAADAREIAHWRVEMEAKQGSLDATVDPAAIADLLNLSTQRVREIDAAMVPAIVEISGSDTRAPQRGFESVAILDVLADESRTTAVERATTEKAVAALLGEVDDQRQVQAVSLRFGLDDGQPRTFVQVGKEMGATEAEVKALVRDARRKMRMFSLSPEERDVVCLRTGMTTGRKVGARETAQRLSLHQADADALYRRGQAKVGALPAQFA